jgi:branched-chain amino acid transport system permease protein
MTWTLLLEQLLNGLQFGLMLFLIAAGLTWCSASWTS